MYCIFVIYVQTGFCIFGVFLAFAHYFSSQSCASESCQHSYVIVGQAANLCDSVGRVFILLLFFSTNWPLLTHHCWSEVCVRYFYIRYLRRGW